MVDVRGLGAIVRGNEVDYTITQSHETKKHATSNIQHPYFPPDYLKLIPFISSTQSFNFVMPAPAAIE